MVLLCCVVCCGVGSGGVWPSGGLTSPGVEQGHYTVNVGGTQSFGGVNGGTSDVELEAIVGGQTESFQSWGG